MRLRWVLGSIAAVGTWALLPSAYAKENSIWVGAWACSPQLVEPQNRPPDPGLAGNTLRQVVHVTLGGGELRLRLSNEFGSTPLSLDSVHIALPAAPGTIRPETDHPLTFSSKASVTIPEGALMFSDPIAFAIPPLSDLVVTLRASKVPEGITGHPGSRETSYLVVGEQVSAATLTAPVTTDHWYILDGVDVRDKDDAAAVVTLGDSITDGRGSITNQNTRWPDDLARSLATDKRYAHLGVLNQGIGGNRILRDGLGPNALARFDRDVVAQSGVRWVLVFEGVNDIGSAKDATNSGQASTVADQIIDAYQQLIVRAHTHGLRIFGATITPFGKSFYYSASTEAARQKVNAWIRTSEHFDAVVDFDKAARDPNEPDQLALALDSGDHLHLNSEGYKRLAAAIDLKLFSKQPHSD